MIKYVLIYLAAVSLALFITMGVDKSRSKRGKWRISERALFLIAVLGGSLGGCLGMIAFRHKTRDPAFKIWFPVLLLLQIAAVVAAAVLLRR